MSHSSTYSSTQSDSNLKSLTTSDLSDYFQINSKLLVEMLKKSLTFDMLKHPLLLNFLSKMAQKTDSAYNTLYGGSDVKYENDKWNNSFTDDFFTALLLFRLYDFHILEPEYFETCNNQEYIENYKKKLVHLGWFFGRIITLTPSGPISSIETR